MLIFFDESFRESESNPGITLGALCGIAIPEGSLHRVTNDVYQLKLQHLGNQYARDEEIKGRELLSKYVFKLEKNGQRSNNLALARDLLDYIAAKRLIVFGCVCFEKDMQKFKCSDVLALDKTFRYIFERIDTYIKIEHPTRFAKVIFDDRDYGTNKQNSMAITNFFQRSPRGLSLDSIIKTPFFAISEAQNVGIQLADFVTTIVARRFASDENIKPFFKALHNCFYTYNDPNSDVTISSLKILRGKPSA